MFYHNFSYNLKIITKNRALLFWTFAFPLILGTLFFMAFKDIEKNEKLDKIRIAIIETDSWQKDFFLKEAWQSLSDVNQKDSVFHITYETEQTAKQLLKENQIEAYILYENEPEIFIKENGVESTIIKYTVEEISIQYQMNQQIIMSQIKNQESNLELSKIIEETERKIKEFEHQNQANIMDNSSKNMSYTMIEYYSLIAMTCLYGGIIAMVSMNQILANMSQKGKRISISSTKKSTLILINIASSFLLETIGLLLLFAYTILFLKIDYGPKFFYIIVLSFFGIIGGLSLGIFVSSVCKTNENTKTGIILSLSMFGSFLSGMMGITMKYIVDKNIPLLNQINPINMITDGLYALYYYEDMTRYYQNLISIILFSLILISISITMLRRQTYDSI